MVRNTLSRITTGVMKPVNWFWSTPTTASWSFKVLATEETHRLRSLPSSLAPTGLRNRVHFRRPEPITYLYKSGTLPASRPPSAGVVAPANSTPPTTSGSRRRIQTGNVTTTDSTASSWFGSSDQVGSIRSVGTGGAQRPLLRD